MELLDRFSGRAEEEELVVPEQVEDFQIISDLLVPRAGRTIQELSTNNQPEFARFLSRILPDLMHQCKSAEEHSCFERVQAKCLQVGTMALAKLGFASDEFLLSLLESPKGNTRLAKAIQTLAVLEHGRSGHPRDEDRLDIVAKARKIEA